MKILCCRISKLEATTIEPVSAKFDQIFGF